jgi:hypothetical protein
MHTIKLNVQDSIYSHIMFFLKNLNPKELEIIEDNNLESVSKLENHENSEIKAFSNHSANLIDEWKDQGEDEIWK